MSGQANSYVAEVERVDDGLMAYPTTWRCVAASAGRNRTAFRRGLPTWLRLCAGRRVASPDRVRRAGLGGLARVRCRIHYGSRCEVAPRFFYPMHQNVAIKPQSPADRPIA